MRLIFLLCLILLLPQFTAARSFYWNEYFGYGDFGTTDKSTLILENKIDKPLVNTVETDDANGGFVFTARMANKHFDSRKKYTYTDSEGNTHREKYPAWGVILRDAETEKSLLLRFSIGVSSDWEYTARDCVKVELIEADYSCEKINVIDEKTLFDPDFEIYGGMNSISIVGSGDSLKFMVGRKTIKDVFSLTADVIFSEVGFIVFPAGGIEVETIELDVYEETAAKLYSEFDDSMLADYLKVSTDNYEGYWKQLDRSFEENLLRMGGSYTLALVKREYGYDLIYVDGAEVCAENWNAGMVKARLTATEISGVFKLVWYDVEMQPMHKDIVAQIENGNVMTITFPYQNSKLRLYKCGLPASGSSTAP